MNGNSTSIGGIQIPSTDPVFLTLVAVHVLLGVTAVISGAVAMLSRKGTGSHPVAGTLYFWCLGALAVTAAVLATIRWAEDYHLFALGSLAFIAGLWGRSARRQRRVGWTQRHILGMSISYVLMLTAFYVDNGKNLPFWRNLPAVSYWLLPAAIAIPFIVRALHRYGSAKEQA